MLDKQLSKKKRKEIARMWVAGFIMSSGMDAFDDDVTIEDMAAITEEAQAIGERILGNRPYLTDLPSIIKYVKKNQ